MAQIKVIDLEVPEGTNIIVGRTHFIKSVEDIYEALITSCPSIRFGIGFCEASQDRLVRYEGNDTELEKLASEACLKAGVGHMFVIYINEAWPINILNRLKQVMEIVSIDAATANPVQLVIAETGQGRALLGVVDGFTPTGIEGHEDRKKRIEFLRKIGYKLG
ncbi:MAG: adenosine-specific kinase [Desulfurococcales archaeon]|nr:adenosine-specific kinase [Desulfurococcales archaeon]